MMTLPPRHPATKSALFSLILDVRVGFIQIPARGETQETVSYLSAQSFTTESSFHCHNILKKNTVYRVCGVTNKDALGMLGNSSAKFFRI